jgi:hypothetical protein
MRGTALLLLLLLRGGTTRKTADFRVFLRGIDHSRR